MQRNFRVARSRVRVRAEMEVLPLAVRWTYCTLSRQFRPVKAWNTGILGMPGGDLAKYPARVRRSCKGDGCYSRRYALLVTRGSMVGRRY